MVDVRKSGRPHNFSIRARGNATACRVPKPPSPSPASGRGDAQDNFCLSSMWLTPEILHYLTCWHKRSYHLGSGLQADFTSKIALTLSLSHFRIQTTRGSSSWEGGLSR